MCVVTSNVYVYAHTHTHTRTGTRLRARTLFCVCVVYVARASVALSWVHCDLVVLKLCRNPSAGVSAIPKICSVFPGFWIQWPGRFSRTFWRSFSGGSLFSSALRAVFFYCSTAISNTTASVTTTATLTPDFWWTIFFFSGLLKVCYFHRRRGHCSLDAWAPYVHDTQW